MKSLLLIIDAQNDFCRPSGSLYVPGAEADMLRLASFIAVRGSELDHIALTQDAHQIIDISHPCFWVDAEGKHPEAFTQITLAEVEGGKWRSIFEGERASSYLRRLEENGEYPHVVWPEHCIAGSEGAAIVPEIMCEVMNWARDGKFFTIVQKGQNPFTEHFGAIRACVVDEADPRTAENRELLRMMEDYHTIYLAGEARSHCVASTVKQILPYPALAERLVILQNCMSPVRGFEHAGDEIYSQLPSSNFVML